MNVLQDGAQQKTSKQADVKIDGSDQYLTFFMADEEYGVDILCVQEIRGWEAARVIPNAAAYVKGVLDLRGVIVPIIDLRKCFGFAEVEYGPMTVVIVIKINCTEDQGSSRTIGILVDAVSDVYSLDLNDLREAPDLGEGSDTGYIKGMVNIDNKMVVLLNVDLLFNLNEMPDLSELAEMSKEPH